MTTAVLRRSGGSLIMTIPPAYAEQNHLAAGAAVEVTITGPCLQVVARPRFDAATLLAETPPDLLHLPEWDAMPPVGLEA